MDKHIERIEVWRGYPGSTIDASIHEALSEAKRLDPDGVRDAGDGFGTLQPFLLLMNGILLTIDAAMSADDVMTEFQRRADNGEGLYQRPSQYLESLRKVAEQHGGTIPEDFHLPGSDV